MKSSNQFRKAIRNSRMSLNEVYFWTSTIKDWKKLLNQEKYKKLVVDCLKELVEKQLIKVYAFVIMPNHIHLIWELCSKNGREMPHASFSKKTAYEIVKDLKSNHVNVLKHFKVQETEREYRVWQRDALAILMDTKFKVEQKIDYIHTNPLQERWNLAESPEKYVWSSAKYYETGIDDFGILTHYMEQF